MRVAGTAARAGLVAAALGLMAAPAWADNCPAVKSPGPGSGSVAAPQGAPADCTRTFYDGAVTLQGRPIGSAYDSYTGTTYVYDQRGNLLSETYSNGTHTDFRGTDAPLTTITDPLGHTTTFVYDTHNNVTQVTDALGDVTHYAYDSNSRVIDTLDTLGRHSSYAYDAQGNMVTTTDPSSATTTYTYNPSGQLTQYDANGLVTSYTYNGGEMTGISRPDGTTTTYAYDPTFNQVVMDTETGPSSRTITYTYNAFGELSSIDDPASGVTSYTYDAHGRMLSEVDPIGLTYQMQYDAEGNRVMLTDALGLTYQYSYDASHRLIGEKGPSGDPGLQFSYGAAYPEPGAWTLMLMGFASLGLALRRRALAAA